MHRWVLRSDWIPLRRLPAQPHIGVSRGNRACSTNCMVFVRDRRASPPRSI